MTSGLRESLTKTLAGLAGKFTEWSYHAQAAAQDAYAVLLKAQAGFARLMGRDEMADTLEQDADNRTGEFGMSANLRRQAAGQGARTEAGILAAGVKSVDDTKKLREQQEKEAEVAETAFAASTQASKASVAAARAAAVTPDQTGTASTGGTAAAGSAKASSAINTAAVVGTQAGQEALFKALGGSVKGVTPGDRLIAQALDQQTAAMARQHREAMRNNGGVPPIKVEKTA